MSERTIGGKYVLEHELASGGMGTIWVALDPKLQRRVALKLMASNQVASAAAREQFEREAQLVARLQSPHVVQIHDYGIDAGSPYIVMELLEGEDLKARLERQGRLPLAAVSALLAQAARGLSLTHSVGVIHRDLKPANLFLARGDGGEVVKLLDFGLARDMAGQASPADGGTLAGTPHYMSPEQLQGGAAVDHRSDLWSLGVIAYRALAGRHVFSGESVAALAAQIGAGPILPPSEVVPGLGPEVDRFFERALAREPDRRFQSASEMAAAFAALVEPGRPGQAVKILVIDDEPDVALLMKQRFRRQIRESVYEFVFAANGQEALEQIRQHPDIGIALCDINMPVMDGLTFLARVGEVNPLVKVIIVSAYSDMTNIRVAMNRGAFDFLVKPIDFQDLEVTLGKVLKHTVELRKMVRSSRENDLLRLLVGGGIVERLVPMLLGCEGLVAERVEATVAFVAVADLCDARGRDLPEAVVRLLNAGFEVVVPELTARGGVVDRFLGEGVMAVFRGERNLARTLEACLAARRQFQVMIERTGGQPPWAQGICAGIDSGSLISGSVGSRAIGRIDYTVLGEVVDTATRLAFSAGRNQVLISERLQKLAQERFECEALGPRLLPGGREQVEVYNLVRDLQEGVTAADETASIPGGG